MLKVDSDGPVTRPLPLRVLFLSGPPALPAVAATSAALAVRAMLHRQKPGGKQQGDLAQAILRLTSQG